MKHDELIVAANKQYQDNYVALKLLAGSKHALTRIAEHILIDMQDNKQVNDSDLVNLLAAAMVHNYSIRTADSEVVRLQLLTNYICQAKVYCKDYSAVQALSYICTACHGGTLGSQYTDALMFACAFARTILDDYRREN